MLRGALRTPAVSLQTPLWYPSPARSTLRYLRPTSRHYSTPTQTPENKRESSPDNGSLPSAEPSYREDATATGGEPIAMPPPPSGSPSSSSETGSSKNGSAGSTEQPNSIQDRMRELSTGALKEMRVRGDEFTARVARTFSKLGAELNRVTGYEEIEQLKRKVVEQESRIHHAREAARAAKEAYDSAVLQRAKSQREVNDLLQRKSHWTDEDVSRFTTLVREDHAREHDEARAKAAAYAAEDAVEREFSALMRVILNRYHEEQAWSDKIRSASTYGQLAALALNLAVFVLAIVLVEPWKRRRLAQTFERKVEEMGARTEQAFEDKTSELKGRMDEQARVLAAVLETVHLANQVDVGELVALQRGVGLGPADDNEEAQPALSHPHGERISGALPKPRTDGEMVLVMTASAAAAGLFGWLARSWFG
ncbi:Mdm33 family-domain-containing protein [Dichomitus squalens]|uniref:Sensitive to high expression protein 9, mitochondrial n=1 Tax=Dichomitus squalens TaxID=114155 RepID=A0A4Q9Q541_9APHY|nr:Mdm33 family-domain-containing protein [Dichomitus squalens]